MSDDKTRELLTALLAAIDSGRHNHEAEQAARLLLEAEALVPDNRVDGNGIRIADLEAVDDELAGS